MLTVVKQTRTLVCFVIMFQDHLGRPREKIWCQKNWLEKRMSSPFWNHTRNRRHNRHVIEQNTIFWSPYVCWALDRSARVLQCFEGLWLYFALFVVLAMCIRSGGAGAQVYIHYEGIHTYRSLAYVFLFFALAKKKKRKKVVICFKHVLFSDLWLLPAFMPSTAVMGILFKRIFSHWESVIPPARRSIH